MPQQIIQFKQIYTYKSYLNIYSCIVSIFVCIVGIIKIDSKMSFIFECIVIIYFDILEMAFNVASVKLDPESAPIDLPQSAPSSKPGSPSKNRSPTPERITSGSTIRHRSGRKTKTPVTVKTLEMSLQPLVSRGLIWYK